KLHKQFRIHEETYSDFDPINDISPRAEVKITEADKANQYTLKSTGYIDDKSRTVTTIFEIGWDLELEEKEKNPEEPEPVDLPPFAVFTSGQFTMSNGHIKGDIGTISNSNGNISFPSGGPTLNGSIYVPNGDVKIVENKVNIQSNIKAIDEEYIIPHLPEFPSVPNNYMKLPDRIAKKDSN